MDHERMGDKSRRRCGSASRGWMCVLAAGLLVLAAGGEARAHPVPRRQHDRTITVRPTPAALVVDYRLDVDEYTVVYVDLPALVDVAELARLPSPEHFYDTFTRVY